MTAAAKPSPRTYHLHRERQRGRILSAASQLFDQRGIDRTTMARIIAASGMRASTVYEYFADKDDIVWALFSQTLETDAPGLRHSVEHAGSGLARISALLHYMADDLRDHPPRARFMAQFDALYARNWDVGRLLTLEKQFDNPNFQSLRTLIQEGIADGSLRPDLDPDLTLHAVLNGVVGTQRRLASLGPKVETEYGQPIDRLFRELIRIVLLGLSAPALPVSPRPAPRAPRTVSTKRKRNL